MATTSPAVQSSARPARRCGHAPVEAQLTRYRDGQVFALSLTEPGTVYALTQTPAGFSCGCKGYQYRGTCYHAAAALARFGPACWHCAGIDGVAVYTNGWDGGAEIVLCASCAGGR